MTESTLRIRAVFAKALELSGEARAEFVERACGQDSALAEEIRSLLRAQDTVGSFLESPVVPLALVEEAGTEIVPERYRTLRTLGSGGMGTVYLAQQTAPVERQVALKVLNRVLSSGAGFHRFDFERQAVALMDHTHVAKLFDSGTTADGRPYFAMEYVPGQSITSYAKRRELSIEERVRLMIPVCLAVHHAHQKGVIHRDLKPENILIMEQDGHPIPKVIDFGVAKALRPQSPLAEVTTGGMLIGTLVYMSPEQALRAPVEVDTRADIYSLGVILYQLVTGALPLALEELGAQGLSRVLHALEFGEPPAPSTRVALPNKRRVRGDLDRIVLKAMAKEPARRYAAASALAEDLLKFLKQEPVSVGPPGAAYRLRKFARRHSAVVIGAMIATVALAAGLIVTLALLVAVSRERDNVLQAEEELRATLLKTATIAGSLSQVAADQLANIAGNTQTRLQLARTALSELREIVALPQAPPGLEMSLGYAYQRLGEAQAVAGQAGPALESFQEALKVRQQEVERVPGLASRRTLGVGRWKVSEGLLLQGLFAEAREHDRAAHEIFTQLVAEGQLEGVSKGVYLGIAERRMGEGSIHLGEGEAALAHFERCLAVVEEGLIVEPENTQLLSAKALAMRGCAEAKLAQGELPAARSSFAGALEILESLGARSGSVNLWERTHETRTRILLADLCLQQGDLDCAQRECTRALELATQLRDADPQNAESALLWSRAQVCASRIVQAASSSTPADLQAALEQLSSLMQIDPTWMWPRREKALALLALASRSPAPSAHPLLSQAASLITDLERSGSLPAADARWLAKCREALAGTSHR